MKGCVVHDVAIDRNTVVRHKVHMPSFATWKGISCVTRKKQNNAFLPLNC